MHCNRDQWRVSPGIPEGLRILVGPPKRFLLSGWHLRAEPSWGLGPPLGGDCRFLASAAGRGLGDQALVAGSASAAGPRPAGGFPTLRKMRTPGVPLRSHSLAKARSSKNKASEWEKGRELSARGERTNGSEPTRCPRAPRTCSGGAHVWRRQVPFGGPTEPAQFPFSEAGI